jgi:hypothetical protein
LETNVNFPVQQSVKTDAVMGPAPVMDVRNISGDKDVRLPVQVTVRGAYVIRTTVIVTKAACNGGMGINVTRPAA